MLKIQDLRRVGGAFLILLGFVIGCRATWAQPPVALELPVMLTVERIAPAKDVGHGQVFMGIRPLGMLAIRPDEALGSTLAELSGLGWDEDEGILYAISDQGRVLHLQPRFEKGELTGLELLAVHALRFNDGRALHRAWADAEGLQVLNGDNGVRGDSELMVSFERMPRIVVHSPQGHWLRAIHMPGDITVRKSLASPNRGLEAVSSLPGIGVLTGPERPLASEADGILRLYGEDGRSWPVADYNLLPFRGLVALEALDERQLLMMERNYLPVLSPMKIVLKRVTLGDTVKKQPVAVLDSSQGWQVDNFEGLTRYRGNRFLMVSDDNDGMWSRILLFQFELMEVGDVPPPLVSAEDPADFFQ